jgi:ATP-dependent Clp protease, protease subunit
MHKLKLLQLLSDNRAKRRPANEARIVESGLEATVYLYEPIVSDPLMAEWYGGITAVDLVPRLAELGNKSTIHLRIDSPGGDVFAAQAIAQAIRESGATVIAHVDGLAASAATVIASACSETIMAPGAMYMIHNAWTVAMGNANDFTEVAAMLSSVDASIAAQYASRTGLKTEELRSLMDAETWLSAEAAVEKGFADSVAAQPDKKAAAQWNLAAYAHAPGPIEAVTPPPAKPAAPPANPHASERSTHERRLALIERTA